MSIVQRFGDGLVGRVSFPLTNWLYNRRGVLRKYRALLKSEQLSADELQNLQLARLRTVLELAKTRCPYYAKAFRASGVSAADLRTLEDFKAFPKLSREDLVQNRLDLVDERSRSFAEQADEAGRPPGTPVQFAPFRASRIVRNTSSGSTGVPTVFYEDGTTSAISWAHELRLRAWYGIRPGARESRLARLSTEFNPQNRAEKLRQLLWHQQMLPGTNLAERDYEYCVQQINRFKPQVVWGYPSAVAGLGKYLADGAGTALEERPKLAITWAGPLYDHEHEAILAGLANAVTNIYGSREVGHVAQVCPAGSLHVNQEWYFVEHEESEDGRPGEILVTTLWPSVMPFIRYRMGDVGAFADSRCSCGRNLQVIDEFVGRTGEIFVTTDGRMISPNFWCRVFMNNDHGKAVDRFQVVYGNPDSIRVRIVRNARFTDKTEIQLKQYLKRNFDPAVRVEFDFVRRIHAGTSGKYQMVVRE